MSIMLANYKITAAHLSRKAIIYLRQSSLQQVKHNLESQRLQYALSDRVKALGFEKVEIIDRDLGISAGLAGGPREGFKHLLAAVALGEVGIVMSREVSRLSRTDKDWCHLMELCQIFNTLIGDAEQIYDLNGLDDQLMLGIKGTMSVAELKILKLRMEQGKDAKAKRGELFCSLSPGFVKDGKNRIVKDPSVRVQESIALVFSKFQELGSIRKTYCWFLEHGIKVPIHQCGNGTFQLEWKIATLNFMTNVLHNPLYAGAYVYGRRPIKIRLVNGRPVKSQDRYLPLEQAKVFRKDAHQGYISWETYERNQRMIRNNGTNFGSDEAVMAVRRGQGLLTGMLRCARCGRKLQIRYYGKAGTTGRYLCPGDFLQGGGYCMGFGSHQVDRMIGEEIVKTISPLGLAASVAAIESMEKSESDQVRALKRELQQMEYEVQRVFSQYDQVDPSNRLVAETLEHRWNQKLEEVQKIKARLDKDEQAVKLSYKEKKDITFLGEHFEKIWSDPICPMELKKKIARVLIEDIIVNVDEQNHKLSFVIHWTGGCHTSQWMDQPQSAVKAHKSCDIDVDIIRKMACYSDEQIAQVLSRLGRKTGKGNPWNKRRVAYVRKKYKIVLKKRDPNLLSLRQAMQHCDVSDNTIKRLINAKLVSAVQVVTYAPLEISRSDLDSPRVQAILDTLKATGNLCLEGYTPDNQPDLFE